MADSYRLTVLKRLTTLLEGIAPTPVTGTVLPSMMTGLVFRGRAVFGANDPDTMLSILESPRPLGASYTDDNSVRKEDWQLLVQGWCPDDKVNPTDPIYSLLDDVELRLERVVRVLGSNGSPKYPEHYMLGAAIDREGYLIASFQIGPGVVRPPTENISSKSFFYVPVRVELARVAP